MPELPEVETVARTLAPQIEGRRIAGLTVLHAKSLQADTDRAAACTGAMIRRVHRRAKLLLVDLATSPEHEAGDGPDLLLAFHLKMTGRFFVHPPNTPPNKHTRLIFDLEGGGRVFFDDMRTFGYCRIFRPDELEQWDFWTSLGPEPLETEAEILADRLAAKTGSIKAALLDQTVLAGAGNIYADESLFRAGVLPTAKASAVPRKRLVALARALQEVLRQAIEECGSSIRDYRDANGNAGAFQNRFAVYGRKGEACVKCGRPLTGARVAGRGTVFCEHCQK